MGEEIYQNDSFDVDHHPDALYDHLFAITHPWKDTEADDFWERFYTVQEYPDRFSTEEVEMLVEQAEELVDKTDRVHEWNVDGVKDYL